MDPIFGTLISAGGNLLSGLLGSSSSDKANAANLQMAKDNLRFQQESATQGLTWRAVDANQAQLTTGINRLAMLGVQPFSPSPVSAGQVADNSMGAGVAAAGQDISRAAEALSAQNVKKADLENKLLEAQIARTNADTVATQAAASKATVTHSQATPGLPQLYQQFSDGRGGVVTLPSDKASQAMQNWASLPAQVGVAAGEIGRSAEDFYTSVVKPWVDKMGALPHRGDWGRRFQYPDIPF